VPETPNGFLNDKDGDRSSKRLFGFIALLALVAALAANLVFGNTPDSSLVGALSFVVMAAIGGAASDAWVGVFKKPGA
jgi:hypothetical protein